MAKKSKSKSKFSEHLTRLKCSECGSVNYYTRKNRKKFEGKISLKKYCPTAACRVHRTHAEAKK